MDSYELSDVLKKLREVKVNREAEIEDSVNVISNNAVNTFNKTTTTTDDVKMKRFKLSNCLLKYVRREQPKDYPLPESDDLCVQTVRESKAEIGETQRLYRRMRCRLKNIESDIAYLESKTIGIRNMREACLDAAETVAGKTYEKEYAVMKRLFQEVKKDLHTVIDTLFPNNASLKNLLGRLTVGYGKGGDNVYVNVTPEILDYVNFLLEADIVAYHRNDKTKIRIAEML